jgi:hypothetical protein
MKETTLYGGWSLLMARGENHVCTLPHLLAVIANCQAMESRGYTSRYFISKLDHRLRLPLSLESWYVDFSSLYSSGVLVGSIHTLALLFWMPTCEGDLVWF